MLRLMQTLCACINRNELNFIFIGFLWCFMNTTMTRLDFSTLLPAYTAKKLLKQLNSIDRTIPPLPDATIDTLKQQWQNLPDNNNLENFEKHATDWLISLFNTLFATQHVQLIRGEHEPEYFPASHSKPARIEFAHGFFASALHEISHWCLAGRARRLLNDFGYWYAPDGRSAAQQRAFEQVEIKPQAIECLLTLASQRPFQVSQDNLFADFDTSNSTFAADVYQQAGAYIRNPDTLPRDAQSLLRALLSIC